MTLYLIKVILCSGLLLLAYLLFMEKEKMHRFNRLYLLGSIFFSFAVPLVTLKFHSIPPPVTEAVHLTDQIAKKAFSSARFIPATDDSSPVLSIPVLAYLTITLFLLIRLLHNLCGIFTSVRRTKTIACYRATLVLTRDKIIPHSFLHYIFIDKEDYEKGKIEREIFRHELTHVRQRHSLDILFIELIHVLFWFNPFIIFYSKAIRLNHEFLADESVVSEYNNPSFYQRLLLAKVNQNSSSFLTSQFNYVTTKKRLLMITKTTTGKMALCKQFASIPLFAVAIFLFSAKLYSQVRPPASTVKQQNVSNGTGASQELLEEYDAALRNMTTTVTMKNGKQAECIDMGKCDADRMAYIYRLMSQGQQDKRNKNIGSGFIRFATAPAKRSPTATQLQAWTDSNKYGVWLDGKRINNNKLSNYQPSDFALYWESRLAKNAANYGRHYYQVDLYTPSYYEESYTKIKK